MVREEAEWEELEEGEDKRGGGRRCRRPLTATTLSMGRCERCWKMVGVGDASASALDHTSCTVPLWSRSTAKATEPMTLIDCSHPHSATSDAAETTDGDGEADEGGGGEGEDGEGDDEDSSDGSSAHEWVRAGRGTSVKAVMGGVGEEYGGEGAGMGVELGACEEGWAREERVRWSGRLGLHAQASGRTAHRSRGRRRRIRIPAAPGL